jgi:hypothetical protein
MAHWRKRNPTAARFNRQRGWPSKSQCFIDLSYEVAKPSKSIAAAGAVATAAASATALIAGVPVPRVPPVTSESSSSSRCSWFRSAGAAVLRNISDLQEMSVAANTSPMCSPESDLAPGAV